MGMIPNFFKDLPVNLFRYIKRKTRRYNVTPRAEKQMDLLNKTAIRAPNYESTMKEVEKLMKEIPKSFDNVKEKDQKLLKSLENLFVSSKGDNAKVSTEGMLDPSLEKRLNESKTVEEVPVGKYNLQRVEHFLSAYHKNQKLYNAKVLSEVYKINEQAMRNILKHVKLFDVALPMRSPKKSLMQRYLEETMPKDMITTRETQIMEMKLIEAKDKFDEHHKLPPRDKSKDIRLIEDWSILDLLQGKYPDQLHAQFNEVKKALVLKRGSPEEIKKSILYEEHGKIVRPEDEQFDVFEKIDQKKTEEKSEVKSKHKKNVSDKI